jgi:hypothetical protein
MFIVLLALKITGIQSAVGPEVDMRSMEIAKEGGSPKRKYNHDKGPSPLYNNSPL